jgi:hypothetical protein
MVERETRRECVGGFYQWGEFHGEPSGGLNRPGGQERGWPEGGRCGVWRRATVQCRARRPWELAGVRGLALLTGHARAGVLDRAEVRQRDVGGGGSGCFHPLFFHVSRPGSGQGRLGIDSKVREGVHGYCYER